MYRRAHRFNFFRSQRGKFASNKKASAKRSGDEKAPGDDGAIVAPIAMLIEY
jgi:hypothetical protein